MGKRVKVWAGGQLMRCVCGGVCVAVNDCRWRHCPLLSPSLHCSLYTETIKPLKSRKRVCVDLFQSAAAAPSPVMGNMPPNDAMPGGPMPPGFFQVHPAPSAATLLTPSIPPLPSAHSDLFSSSLQKQTFFYSSAIYYQQTRTD